MTDSVTAEKVCAECGAALPTNGQCERCATTDGDAECKPDRRRWEEEPRLIICVMIFAALFLGFPWLWRSRQMSLAAKIIWTLLISIESVMIFWLFFWVMEKYAIAPIREALGW